MMSGSKPPPLPRPRDQVTFSELVPFRSSKIRLWRSPLVWLVAFTVLFSVVLFSYRVKLLTNDDPDAKLAAFKVIADIAMFYVLALCLLAVHAYSKTDKPMYWYVLPCLFIYLFLFSYLWNDIYYVPFDALSGGEANEKSANLLNRMWWGFTGPGLREELLKGVPILFGAALMVWAGKFTFLPPRLTQLLRVRSPLDGVLLGFGCGCAFILRETGYQYLPGEFIRFFHITHNADGATGDALLLLLPRTMNGWVGHMGYSGIFGYFVGLAVLRRSLAPQLVLGGLVVAALLHGLWDSDLPGGDVPRYVIGAATGLLTMGCFLKARQLEASIFGRGSASFGSIIVPADFTPAPVPAGPGMPSPAPAAAAEVAPPVQAQALSALALAFDATTLPIEPGMTYDLAKTPLGDTGKGIQTQVTQHPTNPGVLGLKNLGALAWYAHLRDGTVQPIDAGRSVRLAPGVSIDFGRGLVGRVVAR